MKNIFKYTLPAAALALALGMTSCTKDLDVDPIDPNLSTELNLDGLYLKSMPTWPFLETVEPMATQTSTVMMVVQQVSSANCLTLMSCLPMSLSAAGVTLVLLVSTSTSTMPLIL